MDGSGVPGSSFDVVVESLPGLDVVSIVGDFDIYSSRDVRRVVFDTAICAQDEVVLDLSQVGFMDSMGVSAVFACRKNLAARSAHMSLVCPGGTRTFRVLQGLGMDEVLTVHPSRDDALAAYGPSTDL